MRLTAFASILFALLSTGLSAQEARIALTFVQWSDDKVDVYFITEQQRQDLPHWTPQQGRAPLDVSEALAKARAIIPGLELDSIRFVKKPHRGLDLWFYIFEFPGPEQVVVLMNGDIVHPEKLSFEEYAAIIRNQGF